MDIFNTKNIKPMLLSETHEPFDSDDYIYELKLDGIRSVLYIDKTGLEIRNKRNVHLNATYPELMVLNKQVKKRCILDGEIFCMKDGKPDFFEIQRRSLMTNTIKIELAMKQNPVFFSAFDILYIDTEQITNKSLMERKNILQKIATENERFSIARYIPNKGIDLYNLTVEQGLEGIVAKRKDSKYYIGKTTKDWFKIKNLKDDDFVICGYIEKENNVISLVLGAYDSERLIYQSHVTLGVSNSAFEHIRNAERAENPFSSVSDVNVIWIKPTLVCIVKYMMRTKGGGLRQPVFKGLRDDKDPLDCVVRKQ
jgi:bifunctional non-homologous end joining protein LigD